jgi:hypothetical protein
MPRYRKLPVEIDAVQWTGQNIEEISEFVGNEPPRDETGLFINTLEGKMFAAPMDWIIKGVKGEFYPCKPDIFEQTYEPA